MLPNSPYLDSPLRSEAQARADRRRARMYPVLRARPVPRHLAISIRNLVALQNTVDRVDAVKRATAQKDHAA